MMTIVVVVSGEVFFLLLLQKLFLFLRRRCRRFLNRVARQIGKSAFRSNE